MSKETFALINDKDQVVNHVVIDKDASDFEQVIADQLAHWNCVRYVETTEEQPVIVLDPSPEIWTTHTEETGFVLPAGSAVDLTPAVASSISTNPADYDHEIVIIKGRVYPADSRLIKENAARREPDWVVPEGETEVSLADAD